MQDQSKAKPKQCRIIFDTQLKNADLSFQFNPVLVGGPGKKECFALELKIISGLCYD